MSKKLIIEQVDTALKTMGFVRRGAVWNRPSDNLVEVVDIQISKNADTYTLNAGVLDRMAHEIFWGEHAPELVEQPQCTIGDRVGNLIDGKDKWWSLDDPTRQGDQLMQSIAAILRFLSESLSRQQMIQWLEENEVTKKRYPPPIINLAILKALTGLSSEALAILDELQSKLSGPWQDRVAQVRKRLSAENLQNPVKAR